MNGERLISSQGTWRPYVAPDWLRGAADQSGATGPFLLSFLPVAQRVSFFFVILGRLWLQVCPGYRCVLCGTVAKSRNSLHSHMSRQHRGISTKDLPVVPMPAPFDPVLASCLLAKAGVKGGSFFCFLKKKQKTIGNKVFLFPFFAFLLYLHLTYSTSWLG